MKIDIIAVGKVKEKFYRDAMDEFTKRLGKYCKLQIIEVADEKTPDGAGEALEEQIKAKEAERILKNIKDEAFVFTLEIAGKKYDSVGFANYINNLGIQGKSHIQFVIGGSLGLHSSVSARSNAKNRFFMIVIPLILQYLFVYERIISSFYHLCH